MNKIEIQPIPSAPSITFSDALFERIIRKTIKKYNAPITKQDLLGIKKAT